ncbi:MAG: GC-type dockerin domain-anchored protein [Phycisphaerales bacterium]
MNIKRVISIGMLALCAGSAASMADSNPLTLNKAAKDLQRVYPGVEFFQEASGRVRIIHGREMTASLTPQSAAELFIKDHGAAFGAGEPDLREAWAAGVDNGKTTIFAYQQFINGLPVEYGNARIMVSHDPFPRVTYAAATLAPVTPSLAAHPVLDEGTAVLLIKAQRLYSSLTQWSRPSLVVYQGQNDGSQAVKAWKFTGGNGQLAKARGYTFFVDCATGRLLEARNEIIDIDINGTVTGKATPGVLPDTQDNPPADLPIPGVKVNPGGVFSALDGSFTLPNGGTTSVNVTAKLGSTVGDGRWVFISATNGGPALNVAVPTLPPGPALLRFNPAPAEFLTAQVNVMIHGHLIHNYYRDRFTSGPPIDVSLPANVNINDACNAFFTTMPVLSINFFRAAQGCPNTGYSNVVAHEYGHFMVNRLNLQQGAFGEGASDVGAMLLYDDPVIGRDFFGPGSNVRDPVGANLQYPCSGGIHFCGQLLGGIWWGIRQNFGNQFGSVTGLDRTRALHVKWLLLTVGGMASNSAHPATAIEVLRADDDDGQYLNGTPNYDLICAAFKSHSIDCPKLDFVAFEFPDGLPERAMSNEVISFPVQLVVGQGNLAANSGRLAYSTDGTTFTTINMAPQGSNLYTATIPAQPCGTMLRYYVSGRTTSNATTTSPKGAPSNRYYLPYGNTFTPILEDDLEIDRGWSGVAPDDDATAGRWTRNVPQLTEAQPGTDHTPTGTICWVTDFRAGTQVSEFDVDNGQTTLTTPSFNAANLAEPLISYWRWYSNGVGPLMPFTNTLRVDISNDDGVSWSPLERVGPDGDGTEGGWVRAAFRIGDVISPTSQMKLRFIAEDITGSIVEAAIDDVNIFSINCAPLNCYPNCDGSSGNPVLNVADFICFLNRFAANDTYANCDGSTVSPVLNIADFICFNNAFAAGCP